jgi:hypothetical protein
MRGEAQALAERFHEQHERLWQHRRDRGEPVPWVDMPETYRQRLVGTFDSMLRLGVIQPGVRLTLDP